jgi:hypothetical protein
MSNSFDRTLFDIECYSWPTPNSDKRTGFGRQSTYSGGRLEKSETITSSPPPKEGCDWTVILRLQPLKSKHSLGCDKIEAQDVFSSSQMSWARDRTVKTTIPAHLESKHSESYDKDTGGKKIGIPTGNI